LEKPVLLDASKSSLLIVDVQDRLLPAMADGNSVVARTKILLAASKELDLPVTVSEQYPKGLGHTVSELASNDAKVFEKLAFSCWRDEALRVHLTALHEGGRPQVIISGIEAHVCVLQTAVDLAQAGFAAYVVTDAVASRKMASVDLALKRMADVGVQVINTEMAVFELLGKAGSPAFKALSGLIR
jgi:nicotinamidase-related amidase